LRGRHKNSFLSIKLLFLQIWETSWLHSTANLCIHMVFPRSINLHSFEDYIEFHWFPLLCPGWFSS
jgi:hypothetical protein